MDIIIPQKPCSKCKQVKPLTPEYFGIVTKSPDGFHRECRECMKRIPLPGTKKVRTEYALRGPYRKASDVIPLSKECNTCHIEKPLDQFGPQKSGRYGVRAVCNECRKGESKEHYTRRYGVKRKSLPALNGGKVCRRCLIEKPLTDFSPDKRASDGCCTQCKKCITEMHQPYRENNRDHYHELWTVNGEKYRAKGKEWRKAHPLKLRQYGSRREAIKKLATVDVVVDYEQVRKRCGDFCYICEKDILPGHKTAFDHRIPLVPLKGSGRIPGAHSEENLFYVHSICNARKGQKLLEEMTEYQRRGV